MAIFIVYEMASTLDLVTGLWADVRRGHGTSCKPAATELLIDAASHHHPTAIQNDNCEHPQVRSQRYKGNNNRRLVTLAEHTSDHGKQTNLSTKDKGEHGKKTC